MPFFNRFLRVRLFLVKMCRLLVLPRLMRPEARTLKRLAAAFLVLILGMDENTFEEAENGPSAVLQRKTHGATRDEGRTTMPEGHATVSCIFAVN